MHHVRNFTCEICGEKINALPVYCKVCGAQVCQQCTDEEEGVCLNCMEARCQICGEYLASRACNICGTLVCEDHGLKVDESTICDNCRKREV
jgi:hypothetical protein